MVLRGSLFNRPGCLIAYAVSLAQLEVVSPQMPFSWCIDYHFNGPTIHIEASLCICSKFLVIISSITPFRRAPTPFTSRRSLSSIPSLRAPSLRRRLSSHLQLPNCSHWTADSWVGEARECFPSTASSASSASNRANWGSGSYRSIRGPRCPSPASGSSIAERPTSLAGHSKLSTVSSGSFYNCILSHCWCPELLRIVCALLAMSTYK